MTLGEYIKKYRTDHKYSMDEFAKRVSMSKAYISILERNYNPSTGKAAVPSLETVRRVALATGTDFNELIARLDGDQQISLGTDDVGINVVKIACRDGTYIERILTDDQTAAIKAVLDALPDATEDL